MKHGAVVGVVLPGRQRTVDRRAFSRADANLLGRAGAWIERKLVHRHVEDVVARREDFLRPVAVVDVPVDDQHPRGARAPGRLRRHRCVVEEAEPHRRGGTRVVPGRAYQREGVGRAPLHHGLDGTDRRAGRQRRRLPAAGRDRRVGIELHVFARQPGQPRAVGGAVNRLDLGVGRGARRLDADAVDRRPRELAHDRVEPCRRLDVARARIVIEELRIGEDERTQRVHGAAAGRSKLKTLPPPGASRTATSPP